MPGQDMTFMYILFRRLNKNETIRISSIGYLVLRRLFEELAQSRYPHY